MVGKLGNVVAVMVSVVLYPGPFLSSTLAHLHFLRPLLLSILTPVRLARHPSHISFIKASVLASAVRLATADLPKIFSSL